MAINLRRLANKATSRVNPNIAAIWQRSQGYETADDGARRPIVVSSDIMIQDQPVPEKLLMLESMNIAGVKRSVYCYPNDIMIPVRPDVRGGDFLVFSQTPGREAQRWKVIEVVETWKNWSHVLVVLQNGDEE